ncbi:hypothetical protein ACJ9NR_32625 [Streptomyces sp. MCC20]
MARDTTRHDDARGAISRRRLLGTAGAAGTAGLLAGAGAGTAAHAGAHHPAPLTSAGSTAVRGFSHHDGCTADGRPDAGVLFIAWQADPAAFLTVRTRLDGADHLTRFVRHESSALFAVPGGAAPGEYVGQSLLED